MAESSSNQPDLPDNEEEEVVDINEMIKEDEEILEEVAAVLGGGDNFNCSYSQGYMKRQPLYSCHTCIPDAKDDFQKAAGICLACSYHCHDGHDLTELYTKRNFRCDCGNRKFGAGQCNLDANKDDHNNENMYNQNFSGVYCVCSKVYPDPNNDDMMIQCTICEDWFHSRHLNVPMAEGFSEMICESCVKSNEFLLCYIANSLSTIIVDETTAEEKPNNEETPEPDSSTACKKPVLKEMPEAKTMLMNHSWRKHLCTCEKCLMLYKEKKMEYLVDDDDTVEVYESKGKEKYKEWKQKAVDAEEDLLKTLPRAKTLDAIAGMNYFKEQLSEYLQKLGAQKRVVTVEDIKDFTNNLKRPKLSENSHYCH